jgi:hypothetical protein
MTATAVSPRQIRVLEITAYCVLAVVLVFGMTYQFLGLKPDGIHIVIVAILIVIYVTLLRAQLRQVTDRIDELEKRLAASGDTRAVE